MILRGQWSLQAQQGFMVRQRNNYLDSDFVDYNFTMGKEKAKSFLQDRTACPSIIKSILQNKLTTKSNREQRKEKYLEMKSLSSKLKPIVNSIFMKKPFQKPVENASNNVVHFPKSVEKYKTRLLKIYS